MGSHHATLAKSDEWLTPPGLLEALGPFDLDPCAAASMPWATAGEMWSAEGLQREWFGRVWCNPPYRRGEVGRWLGRLAEHGCGTALIFDRTETREWFDVVWRRASAVLFLEGRLHFHYADGRRARANAGAPSALVAFGGRDADVLRDRALRGVVRGVVVEGWSVSLPALPAAPSLLQ